jgi:hypothetical protein
MDKVNYWIQKLNLKAKFQSLTNYNNEKCCSVVRSIMYNWGKKCSYAASEFGRKAGRIRNENDIYRCKKRIATSERCFFKYLELYQNLNSLKSTQFLVNYFGMELPDILKYLDFQKKFGIGHANFHYSFLTRIFEYPIFAEVVNKMFVVGFILNLAGALHYVISSCR